MRRLFKIAAIILSICASSLVASAEERVATKPDGAKAKISAPALAAYIRGDRVTALRLFRQYAEQGDANSQAMLGSYYVNGEMVPKNYAEALKWFRRSADQGNDIAEHELGTMYHNGQGVPRDDTEAAKWFRLAAAQGDADAKAKLAILERKAPPAKPIDKTAAGALTAVAIAAIIVQASRQEYYATGHPCACPDDHMRNGRMCGNTSAYVRPGGAHPLCSAADVTQGMIEDYRKAKLSDAAN